MRILPLCKCNPPVKSVSGKFDRIVSFFFRCAPLYPKMASRNILAGRFRNGDLRSFAFRRKSIIFFVAVSAYTKNETGALLRGGLSHFFMLLCSGSFLFPHVCGGCADEAGRRLPPRLTAACGSARGRSRRPAASLPASCGPAPADPPKASRPLRGPRAGSQHGRSNARSRLPHAS